MSPERPAEELYNIKEDPFELYNLAFNQKYTEIIEKYSDILDQWIVKTNDKGQYPENEADLKLMLGIWGDNVINPEYDSIKIKYPDLEGSLLELKNRGWETLRK